MTDDNVIHVTFRPDPITLEFGFLNEHWTLSERLHSLAKAIRAEGSDDGHIAILLARAATALGEPEPVYDAKGVPVKRKWEMP